VVVSVLSVPILWWISAVPWVLPHKAPIKLIILTVCL
jgi:hypothetical protein